MKIRHKMNKLLRQLPFPRQVTWKENFLFLSRSSGKYLSDKMKKRKEYRPFCFHCGRKHKTRFPSGTTAGAG